MLLNMKIRERLMKIRKNQVRYFCESKSSKS